jgi:hypothetical protein
MADTSRCGPDPSLASAGGWRKEYVAEHLRLGSLLAAVLLLAKALVPFVVVGAAPVALEAQEGVDFMTTPGQEEVPEQPDAAVVEFLSRECRKG